MTFRITASTNPHTYGKGTAVVVSTPPRHVGGHEVPTANVMFDEYATKPAITATLFGLCALVDFADTDEGCYLTFDTPDAQLTVALPLSLGAISNAILDRAVAEVLAEVES